MGTPTQSQTQSAAAVRPLFADYQPLPQAFDESFGPDARPWPAVEGLIRMLDEIGVDEFMTRQRLADDLLHKGGVTFSVYSDNRGVEKIFPFDLIPRTVTTDDWDVVERGVKQRITALNLFLEDLYSGQKILSDGLIPRELIEGSSGFRREMMNFRPPGGVYVHIGGIDLVRGPEGRFLVLEDNLRTPSGVSYVLENRSVMKRVLPRVFARTPVRSVDEYPSRLRKALRELSPVEFGDTKVVVLTPGPYNSAYFEHSFLARRMGVDLVQASDLFVQDERVYVSTTEGPREVHVVYRRIDDDFLDPTVFRPESLLGVPGIIGAYLKGNVTLANAIGNGVADDKAVYPFVPEVIRYYLDEDPILDQIPTFICARPAERDKVLSELDHMVVKAVDASGGYGMLFGPTASSEKLAEFADRIRENPRGYIAQPLVELSTGPTWSGPDGVAPRRVDLRPFAVTGQSSWVLPGGLTRVALVKGSYVVNSSQGGGSKDTWVIEGKTR